MRRTVARGFITGWISSAIVIAASAVVASARSALQPPPGSPVRVDPVLQETVQRLHTVTGRIMPRRRSIVASEEEGIAVKIAFDAGDAVKTGDVLAELDATLLQLDLVEALFAIEEAEASVREQDAMLARKVSDSDALDALAARGAAKDKELDDARTAVQMAQARLFMTRHAADLARTRADRVRRRLEMKTIHAPFDGIVIAKLAEVGQWVDVGGAVVEIIAAGRVDAVIDVPEKFINLVTPGLRISIQVPAFPDPVVGAVRVIVPMGDERARTYPVKIDLDDRAGAIKPGMSVLADVSTGESADALTVLRDAVMRNAATAFIYVVRGGAAVPVSVEISPGASADRVVVRPTSGSLAPGDSVIVEGNERLFPGAPVSITNAAPAPALDSGAPPPSSPSEP